VYIFHIYSFEYIVIKAENQIIAAGILYAGSTCILKGQILYKKTAFSKYMV